MAISPEYLGLLRSSINSSPEWKQAWERSNDYLDALRVPADLERELLLLTSFERAIARKRKEPSTSATELAFEEAQKALDATLGDLISEKVPLDRRSVEERVRLYLMQPTQNSALSPRSRLSDGVLEALREVRLEAVPRLQQAAITPRPFALNTAGERLAALAGKFSFLGSNRILAWLVGLCLVGLLIYMSL
jgi:hypothetical protein